MQNQDAQFPQIDAMRQGVDYSFNVKIRNFSVRLRPLSMRETVQVNREVLDELREVSDELRRGLTANAVFARRTLELASTSDVDRNDPHLTGMLLDRMTPDELQFMFKQYVDHCDKVNPALERMSQDELKAMVEDLKKNAATPEALALRLIELSHLHSHNLMLYLLTNGG